MLADVLNWLGHRSVFELACWLTGTAVLMLLLLSRSFRKRLRETNEMDVEGLGMITLILAIIGIAIYNRLVS